MKKSLYLGLITLISSLGILTACNTHTHTLVKTDKVDATCIKDGNIEYYHCTDETCNKIFADKDGKNEITIDQTIIKKTGIHKGGSSDCMHKAICEVCHQEYGELGDHVYKEVVNDKFLASKATCTEPSKYYKSCICGKTNQETFSNGDALGHDFKASELDYKELTCSRCSSYERIYEFEDARSNAWRGEEYDDKLWKIASNNKEGTSGDFYIGRVNDNSVDENLTGKTYLEFDVHAIKRETVTLNIKAALGTQYIYKKAFKVEVNNNKINVNDEKMTSKYGDWNHWEEYEYANIELEPGKNVIRFTIMEGACCDLDYASIASKTKVETHKLVLNHDENQHWYSCEECSEVSEKINHVYDQEVVKEEYEAGANKYYKSCICGQKGSETFDHEIVHTHSLKNLVEGNTDVQACTCGYMSRKFDLATAYSNSWSEGTEKVDKLWRQLGEAPGYLHSGNYVSHIGDVVDDGNHNDEYWIEIGVSFVGNKEIETTLSLAAGLPNSTNWSVMNVKVNGTKIENDNYMGTEKGWNNFETYEFGKIKLKPNQTNVIRISPNKGCLMNWCYLQIDSDVTTNDVTNSLIKA